ncbi:MAG: 4Fe-4S binding protein [Bacteroidetes bacterium]|nr:4Fe-4S binding protein [Bacteroidota bacterium]
MNLSQVVNVDESKCINCHQCISVCPVKYCNNANGDYVELNSELCIGCGQCIDACTHGARTGVDDFELWLNDLRKGVKMVSVVAPAVSSNFPNMYLKFNGWLKSLGVKANFDVSFGAELTVKSYLEHVKENGPKCIIAQPCPAIVSYVEIYKPELIKYLAPADSPMMHTIKMVKKYYKEYSSHKTVIISPCIAKKREFEEVGMGDYNVTMKKIKEYIEKEKINLNRFAEVDYDNPSAERAVLFSTPGGLLRTAEREHPGIENLTRKIEGPEVIYHYLNELPESIQKGFNPLLIDCLNCEAGCNGGTGTDRSKSMDEIEHHVEKRNLQMQEKYKTKYSKKTDLKKIRKLVDSRWEKGLYDRKYVDHSQKYLSEIKIPSKIDFDAIYKALNKREEKDYKDCAACGYDSCEKMAIAIHNGLNKKENCHHYLENIQEFILSNMSMIHQFAKGDLTVRFYDEGDSDVAGLFKEFNEAVGHFRNLVGELNEVVLRTEDTSNEIVSTSRQMAEGNLEQNTKSQEVSAFIEQVTSTILDTHASASLAADVAGKAGQSAVEGSKIVNNTIEGMIKIDRVVSEAAAIIERLGGSTDKIGEIIQVIDDIADQTNLLALNAAIEAARAGEQGRGFAVVADEVRKLAERTSKATSEISSMIKSIIDETHTAVKSIESGTEEVSKGKDESILAGKSLEEILSGSSKVVEAVSKVANNSESQSQRADQINTSIETIVNITRESSAGITQLSGSAETLNDLTYKLRSLVSEFKIDEVKENQLATYNN